MCSVRQSYVYIQSLGWKSSLQLQPRNNSSLAFFTQEEPQVVDEVAVPRLPTGEDEAQLPGVSVARCRCWCTMCSKQGNSVFVCELGWEGKERHACQDILTLMPTWHMPGYSPRFVLPSQPLSQICGGSPLFSFPLMPSLAKMRVGACLRPTCPSVARSFKVFFFEWRAGRRPPQQNASLCLLYTASNPRFSQCSPDRNSLR